MTFQNMRTAIFVVVVDELRHVAFRVTDVRKPFRAFRDGLSLRLGFQRRRLLFEYAVKQLLRRVRSVDVLGCLRSEEHTSELQSLTNLVCRLLLEKKNKTARS